MIFRLRTQHILNGIVQVTIHTALHNSVLDVTQVILHGYLNLTRRWSDTRTEQNTHVHSYGTPCIGLQIWRSANVPVIRLFSVRNRWPKAVSLSPFLCSAILCSLWMIEQKEMNKEFEERWKLPVNSSTWQTKEVWRGRLGRSVISANLFQV